MKAYFLFMTLVASMAGFGQNCKGFYFFGNSEVQMTIYDKKGSESGKMTYTISGTNTNGATTTADFTSEMVNEKGKVITKGAGKYKCTDGVLYVDARIAMPQDQMSAYKDMDVKAEDIYIEYPATMTVGQSLKDVNFKMEVHNKGTLFANTTFDQTNRKVEAKESVTTPAGTWECFKITYDAKFRSAMMPMNIGIPLNMQVTEWFAPGFGIVKTETLNKNGKLMGTTAITSVKK